MKRIHMQLMIDEQEAYTMNVDLDEEPPEGVDYEQFNCFQITELFRGALRKIEPTERYRLDITKRPSLQESTE